MFSVGDVVKFDAIGYASSGEIVRIYSDLKTRHLVYVILDSFNHTEIDIHEIYLF